MSAFKKLSAVVVVLFIALAVFLNHEISRQSTVTNGIYRLEAKRLADDIEDTGSYDISEYPHITGVFTEDDGDLYSSNNSYVIVEADGRLYRVEYDMYNSSQILLITDIVLVGMIAVLAVLLLYIHRNIIKPFGRLNDVPKELAKGNLAVPLPEEKSRFFGQFTWGVNLLRESIEDKRNKELTMQKDKKLLLLSLSHDIKTPLSAIKLNAKALSRGLYKDAEKQREAAEHINARADEIENFVSRITKASSEDFMEFEVSMGEEFLSSILSRIEARYKPQLELTHTEFVINEYDDCILSCDGDRIAECLQNLIENAIKYGDGKRIEICFDTMDGCELVTVKTQAVLLKLKNCRRYLKAFTAAATQAIYAATVWGCLYAASLWHLWGARYMRISRTNAFL